MGSKYKKRNENNPTEYLEYKWGNLPEIGMKKSKRWQIEKYIYK